MREFFAYWRTLTNSYHMLGEHEVELVRARRSEALYPDRLIQPLSQQAAALAALGRMDDLRAVLDRAATLPSFRSYTPGAAMRGAAMELRAHGFREQATEWFDNALLWYARRPPEEAESLSHRFQVASTLYGAERWDEAMALAEGITAEAPDSIPFRGFLGLIAAHGGKPALALEQAEWLAATQPRFRPWQPYFWRALIAAALGDPDQSLSLLQESSDRGMFWGVLHRNYHSFEPLYDLPAYGEFIRPKG